MTVTDGDGDVSTASTAIGSAVQFLDDGPVAAIAATAATVSVDETTGIQPPDEVAGPLAVFAGVANPGTDLPVTDGAAQYAQSAAAVVNTTGTVIGADQEGATTVVSLSIANIDSGLTTTDGHAIQLFLENGIIVGRYDSNGVGGITAADNAAFAVAIDPTTGVLSVVQYVSLHHNTVESGVGNVDASEPLTLGTTITAVVTVTDGDGDISTASTAIGSAMQFLDDGPWRRLRRRRRRSRLTRRRASSAPDEVAGPLAVFAGVVNAGHGPGGDRRRGAVRDQARPRW